MRGMGGPKEPDRGTILSPGGTFGLRRRKGRIFPPFLLHLLCNGYLSRPDFPNVRLPHGRLTVQDHELRFHGIDLMALIEKHGTPLRLTYLPKISSQIQRAKTWFANAIAQTGYTGSYSYAYCTKSSHFRFVLEEALKNDIHLETSSWFDISIIRSLPPQGKVDKQKYIICNGFKPEEYKRDIADLINDGFVNCMPIIDSPNEIEYYHDHVKEKVNLGMRLRPTRAALPVLHLPPGRALRRRHPALRAED